MKLDDENWHCLTVSRRDPKTGKVYYGESSGLPYRRRKREEESFYKS